MYARLVPARRIAPPPPPDARRSFFFNDTAPPEIYTLSLHDALPIFGLAPYTANLEHRVAGIPAPASVHEREAEDRKSTRLNSSHEWISYAVFCLKKKKAPRVSERVAGNQQPHLSLRPSGTYQQDEK